MQPNVIRSVEEISPAWLTAALAASGALTRGAVAAIDVETGRGNWSTSAILTVTYRNGSQGSLPRRLFLKMVEIDREDEFFGPSEVDYYTRDYTGLDGAPLIRCYDAAYSEEQDRYHLLLDDVSETHLEAADRAPTLEYGLALAEALAVLHAHWWGARRLTEAGAPIHSPEHILRFVDIARPGVKPILDHFTPELKPHWPAAIQDLFAGHPQALIARARDLAGFTLIHGDAGHANILVPRAGERPLYLIDRQPFNWSLTTWLGAYDLAYAMVLDWEIEVRRRLEIPVLRRYHEQLLRQGIEGYSWDRLFEDYRLSVPMGVYVATEYCRGGINEPWTHVWLPMLQRALTACDDLACSALW